VIRVIVWYAAVLFCGGFFGEVGLVVQRNPYYSVAPKQDHRLDAQSIFSNGVILDIEHKI